MKIYQSLPLVMALITPSGPAYSASAEDIDKLTTYATMLGRGIACRAGAERPSHRIGAWMDEHFPPGSTDQRIYLPIFIVGTRNAAQQQHDGRSPDSCRDVLRVFYSFPWP